MTGAQIEPGKEAVNAAEALGLGLSDLKGVGCGGVFVREGAQVLHDLALVIGGIDDHEEEVKGAPTLHEVIIGDAEIRAVVIGVLNDQLPVGVIVAGDELVMAHPADLAGVVALVVALLGHHRETRGQQAAHHVNIAAIAHHRSHAGDALADVVLELVRHHVLVSIRGLDGLADHIAVALPAPEVEGHGEIGRTTVVPAVVLVLIFEALQINQRRERRGGDRGPGGGTRLRRGSGASRSLRRERQGIFGTGCGQDLVKIHLLLRAEDGLVRGVEEILHLSA